MRLLYLLPTLRPFGGVLRSADRMANAMRACGHTVWTITPDPHLFPGDSRSSAGCTRFGVTEPLNLDEYSRFVEGFIAKTKVDLLVGYYGSSAGLVAAVTGKRTGIPSVVCLRGHDVDRDLACPVRGPLVRHAIEHSSGVTTVSQEMASKVWGAVAIRAKFVTNSVDTRRFYPDSAAVEQFREKTPVSRHRPTLGIFGELKPKRGLDTLRKVDDELQAWNVLIVGRVRASVRNVIAAEWLQVAPLHSDEQLRGAYGACDVVVQPSWHDGMPNVVLEAMACQRAIVATPVGGLNDLIEHGRNGLLVNDAAELRDTLRDLRGSPRPDLGVAARQLVPSVERECRGFEELFTDLVSRHRPHSIR